MKKIITLFLISSFLFMGSACAKADAPKEPDFSVTMQINNPIMTVNGTEKEIDAGMGTAPVIVNDRTLLPVRSLTESMGGTVSWNGEKQEVTLEYGEDEIRLVIDSADAYLNDEAQTLDTPPTIINDRTMLPVRFIAESFGFTVDWDGERQMITITKKANTEFVTVTENETELEKGLSAVRYDGDYMFDTFLEKGGAKTDAELVDFLQNNIIKNAGNLGLISGAFGCSALSVKNSAGEAQFGRNFDWYGCDALIALSKPQKGYASISTVNTNFIKNAYRGYGSLPEKIRSVVSLYAPLDGMNEKGLCAAVLYIEDGAKINQSTDKPDITTTTAIRLLLNKAADVDEAIELLNQYDMHDSLGMMVHFAISDANGRCVAVEYIDNEMIVTESPVVTNFYLAEGDKQGIGSSQSHTRFKTLTDTLNAKPVMEADDVKNALESVSKHHFHDGETTEWSIVYNQAQGTAQYFHRENYDKSYMFNVK
ncbi:MAG: linear amide C-N hydrolase [Oscillospiraceae bacterium]|nr:linear amide C-N hydrolase [Oscillospiraceae bacterium]